MSAEPRPSGTATGRVGSRPRLSLAVITQNEADNLPRLLDATAELADDLVVVDSGSTDGTVDRARQAGARVIETDWPGFGPQKQRALEACRGDWVLFLDADEIPTARLLQAIRDAIASDDGSHDGYDLLRHNYYLGRRIRYAWSDDWQTRIVRRGAGRWTDALVHERLEVRGRIGRLPGVLRHYSYRTLAEHYSRTIRYAELGARQARGEGRRASIGHLVLRPPAAFLRRYLLKYGFLDGVPGFLVASGAAFGTFLKYAFMIEAHWRHDRRSARAAAG